MASAARRRKLRPFFVVTAAILAAVAVFLLATLPPSPAALPGIADADLARRTVAGAYHVHSRVSDGSGDAEAIAGAAARAGLRFVFVTDHGDGTRTPAPPRYIGGVLCLDGVEISTSGGHYVALDMPASPYPLGGEPSAVAEDVRRLGGFGLAAHPDSPKPELAWSDWRASIDGIEWLNVDSEWRRASRPRLARAFLDYWIRPGAAMTSLLNRPVGALRQWDLLTAARPVVALAAHDAHGGIGRTDEDGRRAAIGGVPSYRSTFAAYAIRAILDSPWTGDAAADAAGLVRAIRNGRVYTIVDGVAAPAWIDFRARVEGAEGEMGDVLRPGPATLRLSGVPDVADVVFVEARSDAREVHGTRAAGVVEVVVPAAAGAWRAEARMPGAPGEPPVPWLVTNPIYFLEPATQVPDAPIETVATLPASASWHAEKDPGSEASISADGSAVRVTYRLASGSRRSQFVALAVDLEPAAGFGRVTFGARSSRPLRLSVQLRVPEAGGQRWGRSAYVDPAGQRVVVDVRDLRPLDRQTGELSDPGRARTLLFVIDLTNARPGDVGEFEISDVRFGR